MIIYEKNNVSQDVYSGIVINNLLVQGRSGIVKGVLDDVPVVVSGNTITIGKGLLIVSGVRIEITTPISIQINSYPVTAMYFQIVGILKVNEDGNNNFEITLREKRSLKLDNIIKNKHGVHEIELVHLVIGTHSVLNWYKTINYIDSTASSTGWKKIAQLDDVLSNNQINLDTHISSDYKMIAICRADYNLYYDIFDFADSGSIFILPLIKGSHLIDNLPFSAAAIQFSLDYEQHTDEFNLILNGEDSTNYFNTYLVFGLR